MSFIVDLLKLDLNKPSSYAKICFATMIIRPCFKNRAELCYFNKIAIAAIWTKARNEASSLS